MFFVPLNNETKTYNKIIEGNMNWFKSDAQKRREARRAIEEAIQRINMYYLCREPTAANFIACGPNYFFPENHLNSGAEITTNLYQRKLDNSKKPDRGITTDLNSSLRVY
jgi:hypothetical protein